VDSESSVTSLRIVCFDAMLLVDCGLGFGFVAYKEKSRFAFDVRNWGAARAGRGSGSIFTIESSSMSISFHKDSKSSTLVSFWIFSGIWVRSYNTFSCKSSVFIANWRYLNFSDRINLPFDFLDSFSGLGLFLILQNLAGQSRHAILIPLFHLPMNLQQPLIAKPTFEGQTGIKFALNDAFIVHQLRVNFC
jgi:hypothetical protein